MNILFLDDDHHRIKQFRSKVPFVTITETSQDCIEQLNARDWDMVFLDHDLGGEVYADSQRTDTGMEVVRHIVKHAPRIGELYIHSGNEPARKEMTAKLVDAGYTATPMPFWQLIVSIEVDGLRKE